MRAYFELYKDQKGEFRWRLKSQNAHILADSGEGYKKRFRPVEIMRKLNPTIPIRDLTPRGRVGRPPRINKVGIKPLVPTPTPAI
jgi:hypothetical protein